MTRIICGVDVASKSLEARVGQQGAAGSFPNRAEGIASLGAFCQAHQVELVAMEATGGYEQQAFAQLSEQGLPVAILNPRAVRQFAQSMGSLEKTDRIDAAMIAWYAEVKKSRPVCLAPQSQQHLRALVTRLRQLTEIRTAQLNQQRLVTDRAVQASFKKLLAVLGRQIGELEQRIAALIDHDPLWRELNQAFRTIKGVADRTVARLMAEMPEMGALSNKTISKLAGVAPLANDSGKHQGKRVVRGGRAAVRERSSSSWPVLWAATSPTLWLSSSAFAPPASLPRWCASPWLISCWCASTPRRARCDSRWQPRKLTRPNRFCGEENVSLSSRSSRRGCGKAENANAFSEAAPPPSFP